MNSGPTPEARPEIDIALGQLFDAPAPAPDFVERLEHRLLAQAGSVPRPTRLTVLSSWSWQARLVAGVSALLITIGLLMWPAAHAAVAQWFGLSVETRTAPSDLVNTVIRHAPLSSLPSYEYSLYTLPRERWAMLKTAGFNTPQLGGMLPLPNGRQLPVPAFLPDGYEWQDARAGNASFMDLGYPQFMSSSGGGGGKPLPAYDRSFVTFLVGGDEHDHLLLLTQFHEPGAQGLSVKAFYAIPSPTQATNTAVRSGQVAGAGSATPTPIPGAIANTSLQIGVIIEPSPGTSGLTLSVGTAAIQKTIVGSKPAHWYHGAWNANGEWVDDTAITSLVWRTDEDIYQLIGVDLSLADLIHMSESMR